MPRQMCANRTKSRLAKLRFLRVPESDAVMWAQDSEADPEEQARTSQPEPEDTVPSLPIPSGPNDGQPTFRLSTTDAPDNTPQINLSNGRNHEKL